MFNNNYSVPLEQGSPFFANITQPAVATEMTFALPEHTRWLIDAIEFILTTDANVANRQPNIRIDQGAQIAIQLEWDVTQAANLARVYRARPAFGNAVTQIGTTFYGPLYENLILTTGFSLVVDFSPLQAGDQISNGKVYGRRWVEQSE